MPKAAFLLSRSMEVRLTTLLGNYDWLTVIDKPSVRPTKQPTERQTDRPIGAWKCYFQTFKKIVTDRRTNRIEYSKSRYIPLPALLTQAEAETCFRSVVFFYLCPWPFMSVCRSVGWYVDLSVLLPLLQSEHLFFSARSAISANVLTRKMYLNEFTQR